jgi:hypothetical protein
VFPPPRNRHAGCLTSFSSPIGQHLRAAESARESTIPVVEGTAKTQDYILGNSHPELSKLAGEMTVGLCNSLKRFESSQSERKQVAKSLRAYCDLRPYQQQRFMGTQILDLSSRGADLPAAS